MHSTTVPSSSTSTPSSSITTTTSNIEQYHYPPISTLRRSSRPGNIDLSIIDGHNAQQLNDPGIYSAPICYLKQTNNHNHHHHQHIQQSSHPYTATFQYQPEQHIQLPSHLHSQQQQQQQHNIHLYQQQQQQQHIIDPFSQHQHTPRTFPLQASPNHYHQYFHFPPSTLQVNVASNGHQSSAPAQNNRLRAVQIQEQQQQWSNPVLSPLMVKRMNEGVTSMQIDDDEDPSASIDALVADVDSSSSDLLDDEQNKLVNESKTSSITPAGTISPSAHLYHRSTSHILTTPPNPLASDDHPDNQLTVGNSFQKTFSPIPSAGFELTSTTNNNLHVSSTKSFFNFESNSLEQLKLKNQRHEQLDDNDNEEDSQDKITKTRILNTDARTTIISANNLIQDENSNQSSTNSSCHNTSSRIFSQILQSSEQQRLSASLSPLSIDVKLSALDPGNNNQTHLNSIGLQHQQSRHICAHPTCGKIFANKSALAKHKLTHSQDRKHKCSKCNKGFKRLDHLHGHMLTHEEEKPHKCRVPTCNRTYCDGRSLKRHIENTHQDILAAIHEGRHDEYKRFLPETAVVKTKDLSLNSDFSIDSIESNSPRSLIDNEQSCHIRTSSGNKTMPTYTFDEEKYIECHICKKSFKNGAALNGHMRLHGGFNEKQPSPSSADVIPNKKRVPVTKRKRINSPSASTSNDMNQRPVSIKNEEEDILSTNHHYQQSFSTLPPCSDVLRQHFYESSVPSRMRSPSSSSIVQPQTPPVCHYTIKNPMSVQPPTKQHRRQTQVQAHGFDESRVNISNGMMRFGPIINSQIFPDTSTIDQHYDDKTKKVLPTENYTHHRQMNGILSQYPYIRSSSNQHPSNLSHISVPQTNSFPSNLLHHILRQTGEIYNKDFQLRRQPSPAFDDSIRYTPSPHYVHSPAINTPIPSPYSNINPSHCSPSSSSSQMCNNNNPSTMITNGTQPSPATNSTSSSCSSSSTSYAAPKKRFLIAMKQETQGDKQEINNFESIIEDPLSSTVLKIVPDIDTPVRKPTSGFLNGTPSSTGASSSSSSSSNTHFNYENILPPKRVEPTPSSFQWPSQFRRQSSLNIGYQMSNPVPSTPYTPPPMLSPFRKGPGLYYRVFSQPTPAVETIAMPTTPLLPFSPTVEESSSPKINIGQDYQVNIPKLRTEIDDDDDDTGLTDELLFSPSKLSYLDEKSLERYEQLSRMNPFLFSPRHSPTLYPLELVYMLLHEYNGDLQRTLAALLNGTAKDIKQCRPLYCYRFPECDKWTKEEIDAFTKAIQTSEKNFKLVSRAVGTKNVRQCIEFHYMPKVSITARRMVSAGTTSVMTRRKRFQMMQNKQQQQMGNQLDDETSSSSFNELRFDEDGTSDSSSTALFSCDIDECSRTFTTDRACRAHRKDHRRTNINMTPAKRSRNIDLHK